MPAPEEGRDNAAEAARSSSPSSSSTASLGSAGAAGAGPPAQAEASHSRVENVERSEGPNALAEEDGSGAEGRSPPRGDESVPRRNLVVGVGDLVAVQAGEAGGAQNLPNAGRDPAPGDDQENALRSDAAARAVGEERAPLGELVPADQRQQPTPRTPSPPRRGLHFPPQIAERFARCSPSTRILREGERLLREKAASAAPGRPGGAGAISISVTGRAVAAVQRAHAQSKAALERLRRRRVEEEQRRIDEEQRQLEEEQRRVEEEAAAAAALQHRQLVARVQSRCLGAVRIQRLWRGVRARRRAVREQAVAAVVGVLVKRVEEAAAQALVEETEDAVAAGESGAGEDAAVAGGTAKEDVSSGEVLDVSHDIATAPGDVSTGAGGISNDGSGFTPDGSEGNGSSDGGSFDSFGSDNAISNGGSGTTPTDSDGFDSVVAVGEDGAGEDAPNTSITSSSNTCNGASTATEDIVAAGGSGSGGTTSTNADSFDADAPIFRSVAEMKDVCGDKMEALNELNRQHSQAKDAKKRRTRAQTRRRKDAGEDLLPQIVATQRSLVNLVADYEGQTDPSLFRDGQIDLEHRYSRRVFKQVLSHWPAKKATAPSTAQKKRRLEPKSSNQQQSKQKRQTGRKKVQATGLRRSKRARGNEGAAIGSGKDNSRVPAPKNSRRRTRKTVGDPEDKEASSESPPALGDVGYSFRKEFDDGWFDGKVKEILPEAPNGKNRRCVYSDGDAEDLSLKELKALLAHSNAAKRKRPTDSDESDEEESSGAESDNEDASTKRRAQKKRSKSKPKAAKRKRPATSNDSEAESDAESDYADTSAKKGAPKKRPVTDAEYAKFKRELANMCRKHQKDGKWQGKRSKNVPDGLRKKCPPELKKSILNALLEKHNLTGMSKGWKRDLWDIAATIARDGKKVNGAGAGDVSSTYKKTKHAETKAKQCTDDGTAALYDEFDGGKAAALRFVEESKQSECKRAELEEKLSKLQRTRKRRRKKMSAAERTKEATERAELAVTALDSMEDVQSEDEARADILDAMKNAQVRIGDAGEMCKTSAKDMMPVYEKSLRNNPTFAELEVDTQENGVRMVKSQICHQQVSVRTFVKLKRKGLVHIHVMKDENGETYKAIFVAAPKWLILHYCQGAAKKYNGGAGNTKNRAPVDTGGHLQVDILNGGVVVNTNAFNGECGHLDDETKRIFQVLSVTETRKGTIDTYTVSMPLTESYTTLQAHQLVLGTAYFYGMNANLECHTREGGILAGVVGAGETVEKQFRCNVTCPRLDSLIEQGLVKEPSLRCDGDHLFGRSTKYMNGIWWVQPVSHRENIIRSWVREKWGEWLIPLCIGAYTGGNSTPASSKKRI